MKISLIVAVSDNDVIAKDGMTPWFVRGEKARFKEITMGHPIIMGRLTHENLPKTLPGRLNVVLSRNPKYVVKADSVLAASLDQALRIPEVKNSDEVFIIGGEEVFNEALLIADTVYLTRVHVSVKDGNKFFRFNPADWKLTKSEFFEKNIYAKQPYDSDFQIWNHHSKP